MKIMTFKKLSDDQDLAIREHVVDNEDDFNWLDSTDDIGQFEDDLYCDVSYSDENKNVHIVIEDCVVMVEAAKAEEILKAARLPSITLNGLWYVKDDDGVMHGPYTDKSDAVNDADMIDGIVIPG